MAAPITTPLTTLLGIRHPIILSGMRGVSGGRLAASVSNAGGLGVVGGLGHNNQVLRDLVSDLKSQLADPELPFGISVALNHGLDSNSDAPDASIIDVIIESRPTLMISTLSAPSKEIVNRLHEAGILVMNLVGHPKHAIKALDSGVDIICSQGYESRGHVCDISGQVLLQAVVEVAKTHQTSRPVYVVSGGGVATGRAIASALMHGAGAVMMSTRFAASEEADGGPEMKQAIVDCTLTDTERTRVFTGRMLRIKSTEYSKLWRCRTEEVEALCKQGILPMTRDLQAGMAIETPHIMGQVAGLIRDIKPVQQIMDELIVETEASLRRGMTYVQARSRL